MVAANVAAYLQDNTVWYIPDPLMEVLMHGEGQTLPEAPLPLRRMTLTDRLKNEKRQLTERLEVVDGILAKLEKSPDTQAILDEITQLGHF